MKEISKITGRDYKPFVYYGAKDAENVIVEMCIRDSFFTRRAEQLGVAEFVELTNWVSRFSIL